MNDWLGIIAIWRLQHLRSHPAEERWQQEHIVLHRTERVNEKWMPLCDTSKGSRQKCFCSAACRRHRTSKRQHRSRRAWRRRCWRVKCCRPWRPDECGHDGGGSAGPSEFLWGWIRLPPPRTLPRTQSSWDANRSPGPWTASPPTDSAPQRSSSVPSPRWDDRSDSSCAPPFANDPVAISNID